MIIFKKTLLLYLLYLCYDFYKQYSHLKKIESKYIMLISTLKTRSDTHRDSVCALCSYNL